MTYIAFLRAINVGGHTVTMEKLRGLFSELGLANVRTYIQSGNVFFDTNETDRTALTQKIEQHLKKALGYEVPTCLRTIDELAADIALDPFASIPENEQTRFCILFLSGELPADLTLPYLSPKEDLAIIAVRNHDAFVVLHQQPGKAVNGAAVLEKAFGVKATARFFHTAVKILEAAKQ